ncbi:MAG: hypothetical protein M5U12_23195 [Verrucomicrobia bacterium]|nr:hypothetical protein [Verrucomicrobiota bacterium]
MKATIEHRKLAAILFTDRVGSRALALWFAGAFRFMATEQVRTEQDASLERCALNLELPLGVR